MKIPTEDQEQEALVNWLKLNGYLYFSIPNGGTRNKLEASKLKRTGLVAGASDIVIFLNSTILFLELKVRPKTLKNGTKSYSNSKVSDEQKAFINSVNEYHYAVGKIAYGYEDAIKIIKDLR